MSKYSFSKDVKVPICGMPFNMDRDLLAARSSKLSKLFKENPDEDLSHLLYDIPATPQTFEIVARFCYGFKIKLTPENIIPVSCLAYYLGMTDSHSPNNLLTEALSFFEQKIIPGWNESLRALKTTENPIIRQQAGSLGLIDACVDSIITKALDNPLLLGEPIKKTVLDDEDDEVNNVHDYRPQARRELFALDWKSDDLTTLSIDFYEPILRGMIQCKIPPEFVASSLHQYARRWVFFEPKEADSHTSSSEEGSSKSRRDAIEAFERLLPTERGIVSCTLLSEMLQFATALDASMECRYGLEMRLGKQLDLAAVKDLLIPTQDFYSKEEKYDTECVRRILKHFYCNFNGQCQSGLVIVSELLEDFVCEVASDIDLKKDSFMSLVEMSIAASEGTQRSSDGIYRAIDIYLDKHRYLTETEREEICVLLDCNKMSPEACEHAARNERLPTRVMVQVLFVGQLKLRETITKEALVQGSEDGMKKLKLKATEEDEEDEEEEEEEEVKVELEKMSSKVIELEKECLLMKKEIQKSCCKKTKKEKTNIWREMKRKLGCVTSLNDCNCHVKKKKKKKVHPR